MRLDDILGHQLIPLFHHTIEFDKAPVLIEQRKILNGDLEHVSCDRQAMEQHQIILVQISVTWSHRKDQRQSRRCFVGTDICQKRSRIPSPNPLNH